MDYVEKSIFSKAFNPYLQALIVLGIITVLSTGWKLLTFTQDLSSEALTTPWTITVSFLLFFAVFNSVFSLSAKDINLYWRKSMISFVALMVFSGFLAYFLSGLSLQESGGYRWLFVVVSIGYLVFISIIGFMRTIVAYAQKEEWNQPRKRRR